MKLICNRCTYGTFMDDSTLCGKNSRRSIIHRHSGERRPRHASPEPTPAMGTYYLAWCRSRANALSHSLDLSSGERKDNTARPGVDPERPSPRSKYALHSTLTLCHPRATGDRHPARASTRRCTRTLQLCSLPVRSDVEPHPANTPEKNTSKTRNERLLISYPGILMRLKATFDGRLGKHLGEASQNFRQYHQVRSGSFSLHGTERTPKPEGHEQT